MFNEATFQLSYFSHHRATSLSMPHIFIENMQTSKETIELAELADKSCAMWLIELIRPQSFDYTRLWFH